MPLEYPETDEDRAALRAKNLDAFEKIDAPLAKKLRDHVPATQLIFDEDGQPDLVFQGQKFYDGKYHEYLEKQLESFEKTPFRFFLAIPQPANLDNYGADFLTNVLKRATQDEGATFSKNFTTLKTFFVCSFGIGLAGHIDRLMEMSDCSVMFVVDPNIESLYHSLEVHDWTKLFNHCTRKRGMVKFLIGDNPISHFAHIRAHVRSINTPGVDGMLIYKHYPNAIFDEAMKEISKSGDLFLAGLGFYSDETKMIENTHTNLSRGNAHIYTRQDNALIPYPCFVVGCGPSLDGDLKYIKEHADNAIVISSGSALGPLLNAGITPDFQMEVENAGILPVMKYVAEHHDISNICLVTSTTVEPDIVDYFKRIIYHFRPALAPYSLMSDDPKNTIPYHDPSVVNSSLGFAQDLGFREFYLFGCDMGTRDADMHHAKNSYHFAPGARLPINKFSIKVPANFGGSTYTSSGLNWVKSNVVAAVRAKQQGRIYYNCSDGAFLEGTVSKFAKSIKLPVQTSPAFKVDFVEQTVAHCPVMDQEQFAKIWRPDEIREVLDDVFNELKDVLSNATYLIDKDYLLDVNRIANYGQTPTHRGIGTWIRGTLQMILLAVEFYGNRLQQPDLDMAFEDIVRDEILDVVEKLHERSIDLLDRHP